MIVGDNKARGRGIPNWTFDAVICKGLGLLNLSEQVALDKAK